MSVIHFGAGDFLQTKVVEAGLYPSEVSKIEGPSKSSSGKSISYFIDITIADGPYKGKSRTVAFNSGTQSPQLLGEMQFMPMSYLLLLAQAMNLVNGQPQEFALDTDNLLHQPMDVNWGVATVEGRLINIINSFHNKGYAASAPAF
jgi:hypothetical protein